MDNKPDKNESPEQMMRRMLALHACQAFWQDQSRTNSSIASLSA